MHIDFPTFLVIATAFTGVVWALDALFLAPRRRRRAGESAAAPKEPWLVEYSKSFFPVILAVLVLRSFLVEPFRIPSGSMMPTLLVGDFILVNKFAYGLRAPVGHAKFLPIGDPQRGDVVVFRYPEDPRIDYIKRVVGVPGDLIDYRYKKIIINGEVMEQTPGDVYVGVGGGARETGALELTEQLGDHEHAILLSPLKISLARDCAVLAEGPLRVPEGHYFVMGDNRDNSNDSRCWGLVPEDNLVGKAFAIWMSWDGKRPGFPVDFSRIGRGID